MHISYLNKEVVLASSTIFFKMLLLFMFAVLSYEPQILPRASRLCGLPLTEGLWTPGYTDLHPIRDPSIRQF